MLNTFATEIEVLSKKRVEVDLANQAILKIRQKLPKSTKKRHELLKQAVSSLLDSIKHKNYNLSFGTFRFIFFTDFTTPLSEVRKQGIFRASKTNFNPKLIKELLSEIYASETLSNEEQNYIRSINGLLLAAADIHDLKKKIITAAISRRYFLKTVLAIAESKFSDLLTHFDDRSEQPYIDILFHNNKESILTAASYLVQVYRESNPHLKLPDINNLDETIDHKFYLELFEAAFAITNYLEAEIKIDFYDYVASVNTTKKCISIDNAEFETAKSYGYVKTDLRIMSQIRTNEKFSTSKSYHQLLEEIWEKDTHEEESILYAIKHEPVERIILPLPLKEYGDKVNIFSHNYPFKEEQMQILTLANENYNSNFLETKIYNNFTIFDLFKIQRLFCFVGFIYKKAYEKLKNTGHPDPEKIRKRSILPVFDKETLLAFLHNTTGKPLSDCEVLLTKLANGEPKKEEVIDLQYNPIFSIDNRYLVMPTVLAYSSLWRSLAVSENVHFSVLGEHDHMVESVAKSLLNQGFKVQQDFDFGEDEIDIAAVLGEHLFLFECKNPYHPVNDFELRNTYAHLTKGFSQLEKLKNRFQTPQVLDQFLRNLKIEPRSVKHIHYGVINANRVLSGFTKDGIRVFHANELINFLTSGKIISAGHEYSCWKTDSFELSDFISYINGEILVDDMVSHKTPMPYWFSFRNYKILFRTFQYDLEKTNTLQKNKYRYIGPAYI